MITAYDNVFKQARVVRIGFNRIAVADMTFAKEVLRCFPKIDSLPVQRVLQTLD